MILGVTHKEDGTPIQRLAISYKVSIGIPAGEGKNHPSKSDHFHIRAKNANGDWVDDQVFYEKLRGIYMPEVDIDGKKLRPALREFDIVFLSDDINVVFKTELAWWATSEKKCSGDGRKAVRAFSALSDKDKKEFAGESHIEWTPCGDGCPDLEAGRCKPNGQLYFIFKDRPMMGSVAKYDTTSYETIRRIHSSLLQIQSVTGGRLRGIPLKIVMRPGRTRYEQDGKVKTGSAFFVNIEFRQEDVNNLVPKLMEHAITYGRSITSGRRELAEHIEDVVAHGDTAPVVEDLSDTEKGKQMTSEFYPDNRESAEVQKPSDEEQVIRGLCDRLALNPAHQSLLNQALKGDISEIGRWLTTFSVFTEKTKMSPTQIHEFYGRAILTPDRLQELIDGVEKKAQPAAGSAPPPAERPKRGPKKNPPSDAPSSTPANGTEQKPAEAAASGVPEAGLGVFKF